MAPRLILFPQYPAKLRYQEWWYNEFPRKFMGYFDNVKVISGNILNDSYESSDFSPRNASIQWESEQIKKAVDIVMPSDILFFCDVSYPGFVPQLVYHFKENKKFGFCHATSLNFGDIFENSFISKYMQELGVMQELNGTFFGTQYSRNKHGGTLKNTHVVGLPRMPIQQDFSRRHIKYDVGIASRITPQKVDMKLLNVLKDYGFSISFNDHTKSKTWSDYFEWIRSCSVIVSLAREETYGYVAQDASLMYVPFIAPNRYGYTEVVKKNLRYNNSEELIELINKYNKISQFSLTPWAEHTSIDWYRNVSEIIYDSI